MFDCLPNSLQSPGDREQLQGWKSLHLAVWTVSDMKSWAAFLSKSCTCCQWSLSLCPPPVLTHLHNKQAVLILREHFDVMLLFDYYKSRHFMSRVLASWKHADIKLEVVPLKFQHHNNRLHFSVIQSNFQPHILLSVFFNVCIWISVFWLKPSKSAT